MIGNPKYNYGDIVKFTYNGQEKQGVIAIIDAYGTFMDNSDVSYDILVKAENTLYKHCTEALVTEKVDHISEEDIWKK